MLARYLASRTAVRSFSAAAAPPKVAPFHYQPLFDLAPDTTTKYKKLENASKHVQVQDLGGNKFLKVGPEALRILSAQGVCLVCHLGPERFAIRTVFMCFSSSFSQSRCLRAPQP